VLSLTASDGQLSSSDTVSITVGTPDDNKQSSGCECRSPAGDYFADIRRTGGNRCGRRAPDFQPGDVMGQSFRSRHRNFGDATKVSTTAAFSAAGTYTLRLTASDTALVSAGDVVITATVLSPRQSAARG
jgi:hypothetical protein